MVIFNELRITEDGGCIVIDCEIESLDVYKDMYISDIHLEYYKNANPVSMPSDKAYLLYENVNQDTDVKQKRIVFSKAELPLTQFGITDFENGLFYAIVRCDGDLPATVANLPCTYDDTVKIGAIPDWKALYRIGMQYVSSLFGICSPKNFCDYPAGFEDFIIIWNSLRLAIDTCNWDLVNTLWDRILNQPSTTVATAVVPSSANRGCGCR